MKRYSFAASLGLALVVVLGLTGPAAAQEQVPFKGSLQGVVTITPLNPPVLSVLVKAAGNATHLGHYTLTYQVVVDFTFSATVTAQFTAANGDQLFAVGTGQGTPTATPGVFDIVAHYTIVGGTGRFEHTSGQLTEQRVLDTNTGLTSGTYEGTIALDK